MQGRFPEAQAQNFCFPLRQKELTCPKQATELLVLELLLLMWLSLSFP